MMILPCFCHNEQHGKPLFVMVFWHVIKDKLWYEKDFSSIEQQKNILTTQMTFDILILLISI
jgi:hypothetical protein